MRIWVLGLAGAMMMAGAAMAETYKGNETPAYTVEEAAGDVELRRYPGHIAAEVTVSGTRDAAVNAGFRVLAGYIFGGNEPRARAGMTAPSVRSEKIAMTTPVTQTGAGDRWTVQFMMPRTWTLETLPKPRDARIRLLTTEPRRLAVLRFSGIATTAALETRTRQLRAWADDRRLTLQGAPQFFFYDAPFTLPWNRRNEVAFDIAP